MSGRAKAIILLGTSSHAGKSVLTAGLCRILKQDGYAVAPFKAQNMALNSFITLRGEEMGRAQVTQAEAAGLEPEADMNPILLKPNSDTGAQVIIHGRVHGNMDAVEYHRFKAQARRFVQESYSRLAARFEVIVCEGAGSPAEINLRDNDLVNLGLAELIQAPCLLVGDIDRGGVFAALAGTLELLPPQEKAYIKAFIINKFRGDPSLLAPGLDHLTERYGRPFLGVVPYFQDLGLPEEDGVAVDRPGLSSSPSSRSGIKVAVVRLPHISNFTDFDALAAEPGLAVEYVHAPPLPKGCGAVILPGTKNTIEDLVWLQETGLAQAVLDHHAAGGVVVGVCGGYQMLGQHIADPERVESSRGGLPGLGLLPVVTTMAGTKTTCQVAALALGPVGQPDQTLTGYEIHMGLTERGEGARPLFEFRRGTGIVLDGAASADGRVWGSYLHGLFDADGFRRWFVEEVHRRLGLTPPPESTSPSFTALKSQAFDRLARRLRECLDLDALYKIIGL